jgi:zinc transporter
MSLQPNQPAELVFAYLFSNEGKGRPVDADTALEWLKQPVHAGTEFLWLHFNSPHGIGSHWLQYIELAMAFRDALHEERRSSRLAHSHHGLFAVMNDVAYDAASRRTPEVATLWVGIRQRWLLSAWDKPLRSVEELLKLIDAGRAFVNPLSLVLQLLSEQADVLVDIVRNAADTANDIEAKLAANELPRRASLGRLRRDLIRLQRLLAPEPASLFRLVSRPPKWVREEEIDYLHLATENFSVALRDMVSLQERIRLLEDEIAARVGERTNRSLFILTSVTVISLPMTVVGALFGMNVGGLPFKESDVGFWALFLISVGLTLIAAWFVFRLLRKD